MTKDLFISDTHFDGGEIIKYENRPFKSSEEMNSAIIKLWNLKAKPDDNVIHLGDFIWSDNGYNNKECKERIRDTLKQLNGNKILVMGNHDREIPPKEWMGLGFSMVYDLPVLYKGFYILSHEPQYINTNMPYANIYGHVHSNPNYRDYSSNGFCACVERIGYGPIEFSEIKQKITSAAIARRSIILPNLDSMSS